MEADKPKTQLQYLLVLDFEATCIQDKKVEPCAEIIEFPIIVLQLSTGKHPDVFHHYVKPTFNPNLTKFCTELTGITQAMVDQGLIIQDVLIQLDKWISKLDYLKEENYTFVTCGDWDLRSCLNQEAKQKRLHIRKYLRNYINIKKYFAKVMGLEGTSGMMDMLARLGIQHEGKHHSGIDDVRNICKICYKLVADHGATYPKKQISFVKYPMEADNLKPEIRYLMVLDFEATCINNGKLEPCSEIIQFPVMLIDAHEATQIDIFHQYVKPKFHPQLSEFCTELTGITQQTIEKAKHLEEVIQDFYKWVNSHKMLSKDNFVFVTCGDWDFNTCLRQEAKVKHIYLFGYFSKYINLKAYFPKVLQFKGKMGGMVQMLQRLKIKLEGKHHSGIDDVRNLSKICIKLLTKYEAKFPKGQIRHVNY